jgi:hypothetical protein
MTLEQILKRYIHLWPDHIRVSDGHPAGSGYMLPSLSRIHAEIEEKIDHTQDHWGNLFTWSMFQACHEQGKHASEQGAEFLELSRVPLAAIDRWVRSNIEGEDWAKERAEYRGMSTN